MAEILAERQSTSTDAGRALIDAANEAGGRDNITVVLFRLEEVGARRRRRRRRPIGRRARSPVGAAQRAERADGLEAPSSGDARRGRRATRDAPRPPRRADRHRGRGAKPSRPARRRLARRSVTRAGARPRYAQAAGGADRRAGGAGADRRRRLPGHPAAVLHRHQPAGDRDDLPRACPTTCRSGSSCTRRSTPPACRTRWCRRRGASELLNNHLRSQSDATSARAWRWNRESRCSVVPERSDDRAQPRAGRPDPGVAAGHRRVRRRVHPALQRALERVADLRRDLPRAVHRRARLHPDDAAVRRPVHVPAGRAAGQLRAGDDLPDRLRRWPASRRSGSCSG